MASSSRHQPACGAAACPAAPPGAVWTAFVGLGFNTFTTPQVFQCPGSSFVTRISHLRTSPDYFSCESGGTLICHQVRCQRYQQGAAEVRFLGGISAGGRSCRVCAGSND